jgi:hypothetical protein
LSRLDIPEVKAGHGGVPAALHRVDPVTLLERERTRFFANRSRALELPFVQVQVAEIPHRRVLRGPVAAGAGSLERFFVRVPSAREIALCPSHKATKLEKRLGVTGLTEFALDPQGLFHRRPRAGPVRLLVVEPCVPVECVDAELRRRLVARACKCSVERLHAFADVPPEGREPADRGRNAKLQSDLPRAALHQRGAQVLLIPFKAIE